MLPPTDNDPDPTSQLSWPGTRNRPGSVERAESSTAGTSAGSTVTEGVNKKNTSPVRGKHRLSAWNLFTLSVSMAGAQIAWTVELGYGTPFLLSLGLSEQITSLVWLAGPISGLIAQPLIGAVSDANTSKYRRRYWIALSTLLLALSTLSLAYCQQLAAFFVDLAGVGAGDWDKKRNDRVASTAIGFAVFSFYVLDFALNALQASLRNLLLDITPPSQLNSGNAWHGRMTHAGNIIGYGFGFLPLAQLPIIRLIGGGQFRKFCIICIIILVATVWTTCWFHEEEERPRAYKAESKGQLREVLSNIYSATISLPKPIRRVCFVQIFAFMGWFPFLFYATTYIGQVMAYEHNEEPDGDVATRSGEFALLLYSIVAVVAGTILPQLASRDRRLMAHKGDEDEDAELTRLRDMVREWRAEAIRKGQPLRLPVMPFLLRNIWTGALLLFTVLTFSTFFITTVAQATAVVSLIGICWAVACWVPFAIIMELLKEPPVKKVNRPIHARALSTPEHLNRMGERTGLLRSHSFDRYDQHADEEADVAPPLAGGTVLGIHNLAIVFPQFIVALVASAIFKIVDTVETGGDAPENTYLGKHGVAWVLRFGGLCTLIGAMIARMVPPTPTEKAMRRRLAEMRLLRDEEQDQ